MSLIVQKERALNKSIVEQLEPLSRDLRRASALLSHAEARFTVDSYYQRQRARIRTGNQIRASAGMLPESIHKWGWHQPWACIHGKDCHDPEKECGSVTEPHDTLIWIWRNEGVFERALASALGKYAEAQQLGQWAMSIMGIGPVLAAGLLAHIDIRIPKSAGGVWRFAGLDPTAVWEKGQKRPWNASLKVLTWKIGESFVKVKGREGDFYGRIYAERRGYEEAKNEAGEYMDQALKKAEIVGKSTEAYKWYSEGLLPPGHLYMRAKRYAVKMFLAHYFEVGVQLIKREKPPRIYAISHLEHVEEIPPPNWPMTA